MQPEHPIVHFTCIVLCLTAIILYTDLPRQKSLEAFWANSYALDSLKHTKDVNTAKGVNYKFRIMSVLQVHSHLISKFQSVE